MWVWYDLLLYVVSVVFFCCVLCFVNLLVSYPYKYTLYSLYLYSVIMRIIYSTAQVELHTVDSN